MSELDFGGKTVLIVGGSSGIGNGIAQTFRAKGAKVHVWGTRPSAMDYDDDDGSDLDGLDYACVDVSNHNLIDDFVPGFDELDVLVMCQGIVGYRRQEFTREMWDAVMDVNLNSLMNIANKFHGVLSKNNGSIIIISSIGGFIAMRGNPAYSASKAGAVSLTKSLGEAWGPDGIRVNGIAPGYVQTRMTKVTSEDKVRHDNTIRSIPLRRAGTPRDMAGAALFLASPLASFVLGQTLIVDGGMTLS